jgi:hypothetical protein
LQNLQLFFERRLGRRRGIGKKNGQRENSGKSTNDGHGQPLERTMIGWLPKRMRLVWLAERAKTVLLGEYQFAFAGMAQRIKFACMFDQHFAPAA